MGLEFDVYSAASPNGARLAILTDAFAKAVTFSLRGIGVGQFSLPRASAQATSAIIAQGNLVKVRLTELSATPIGSFWMETGRFDLVASGEAGAETLTFGGSGALAYTGRAIMWSRSFVAGEKDPVDNEWRLWDSPNGSKAGSILRHLVAETISVTRPQQPWPSLSFDFTYATDSAGNVWATTPGTSAFIAHVGDYLDEVIGQLLAATDSLVVQMDANLGLHAYNTFGTDRHSATFATGKVRLEKAVNIASQLTRELAGARVKSHILTAGDPGSYGYASSAITPVREGFASSAGADGVGLDALAASQISIRQVGAESIRLGIPYGNAPLSGIYLPGPAALGGHYWVGDTITVHTGSAALDYNESSQKIAEITIAEGDGATPIVTVALGSSYSSSDFSQIADAITESRTDTRIGTNEALRFAHSLSTIKVVAALPALPDPTYPEGSVVSLTTEEGKLYRNAVIAGTQAWTASIETVDLTGTVTETQIEDDAISTPKIQALAITANEIGAGAVEARHVHADAIEAGAIRAGAIGVDALEAELIMVRHMLATAAAGRRMEFDEAGLRAYSGNEDLLVNIPTVGTDPLTVKGEIETASLTATALTELRGQITVAAGSTTELQTGVTNPISAPVLAVSTPALTLNPTPPSPGDGGTFYDPAGDAGGATPTFWVPGNPTVGNLLDLAYEYRASDGALLRTLRKTGTTITQSTTLGSTTHVSDHADGSAGASPGAQVSTPLTMPRAGTITKVSAYLAGRLGSAQVRNCIWNPSRTLLAESATYTAADGGATNTGASSHYDRAVSLAVSAGQTIYVGFRRVGSGDGTQYDRDDIAGGSTRVGGAIAGTFDAGYSTAGGTKPNVYITYTYTVDSSVEGTVASITGLVRQGSYIWLLDGNGWLYRYAQATLAFVDKFDLSSRIPNDKRWAGLFWDGTNLVITTTTNATAAAQVRFVRLNTAGAYVSTLDTTGLAINATNTSVRAGYYGSSTYRIALNGGTVGSYAFASTTGAYLPNTDFGLYNEISGGVTVGASGSGAGWSSYTPNKIWLFTAWNWAAESPVYWVCYTWYDITGTVHETGVSPRASITLGRRRQLTITTPAIPGGATEPPDRVRVYLGRGAADPGGTNYDLQSTDALTVRTLATFNTAGAANRTDNNFPAGTAAIIRSAIEGWQLKGSGEAVFTGPRSIVVVYRFSGTIMTATGTLQLGVAGSAPVGSAVMPYAGRILAVDVTVTTSRTAGTATVKARVNNTVRGTPAAVVDGVNVGRAFAVQSWAAAAGGAFGAGAFLNVQVDTAAFGPTGNVVDTHVFVAFDAVG